MYDSVKVNYKLGVKQALDYFLELGHKNIGFIGEKYTLGDNKIPMFDDRLKFFYEYMNNKTNKPYCYIYIKDNRLCDLEKSQLINKLLKLQDNLEAGI